jgi:ParB-like nuclease domain
MDSRTAQAIYEKAEVRYPKAGKYVDGRFVRNDVPNTNSISGYFGESETLPGIRVVKMSDMGPSPGAEWRSKVSEHIKRLAESIRESEEISPLIVGIDFKEGPFIIEGSHRIDALDYLNAKAFPALVVVGYDD